MTEPLDMTQVARDDELIEALIRGEAPPADDELAGLFAAWRADLDGEEPGPVAPRPAAPIASPSSPATPLATPVRTRRKVRGGTVPRGRTLWIAAAAVVVGLAGGTTAAAANAGPDSPLWPITRVVFSDRADSRLAQEHAEEAITKAREAIQDARYTDAERLLDEATASTGQVKDAGIVQQLLDEISAVRGLLPNLLGPGAGPSGGAGAGGGSGTGGGAGPSGGPGGGANPAPTATDPNGGGILPPLPIPVPTISVPCLPLLCPNP